MTTEALEVERFAMARRALAGGRLVVDRSFDDVFPARFRRLSSVHWTPVEVAVRVAGLLAAKPRARILDVGSGVGKFCIVGAAAQPHASFCGVEHRGHLLPVARAAARKVGVPAEFCEGTVESLDPLTFDAVYLFNPFAENLAADDDRIDDVVELGSNRFWRDVFAMERFLRDARSGMRVATYCGWGGAMPSGYELIMRESRAGTLELWEKRR